MAKKSSSKKATKKNLLNKISGGILIVLGLVSLFYSLSTFGKEISLFFPVVNSLSSIALIFLGIYVFRVEKWAIILAGVYGLVMILNNMWIWGLFNSFRGAIVNLAYVVLAINWWFQIKKC